MQRLLCAVVLCLAVGCGPGGPGAPSFAGTYTGSVADTGHCSDGSAVNSSATISWTLVDSGGGVTATFSGGCSPMSGTQSGNVVTLAQKTCQPYTANGFTYSPTVTDGTLTLNGKVLAVLLHNTAQVTGAASGTCNFTTSGNISTP